MNPGDWFEEMVKRGLLTPEQAAQARRQDDPDATPVVPPPSPMSPQAGGLFTCAPCGRVYTLASDPAAPPRCPACGGPLAPASLGFVLPPATAAPAPAGDRAFGRYVLRREIGRGGMGVVYEAADPRLGRTVALKMLSCPEMEVDPGAAERLLREARAAAKLRHPNIVAVHEIGHIEGRHYFTMELVEGTTLEQRLAETFEQFSLADRTGILAQAADALACAHQAGVVHRDVKPANILIDRQGRAVLADFGLARDLGPMAAALTGSGAVLGTLAYIPPERAARARRPATPAGDVFSFGVALYRALAGVFPFRGAGAEVLLSIERDEPPPPSAHNPAVPAPLDAVCLKCLEKDPERRYPDGAALADDLRRFLSSRPVAATPPSWLERLVRRFTRRPSSAAPDAAALRRAEEERTTALRRAQDQVEALRLLEKARPSLDAALRFLYEKDASREQLGKRLEPALALLEQSLRLCAELPLGHYLHGLARDLLGDDEGTEAAFREALRLDSGFGPAWFQLGRHLTERTFRDQLAFLPERRAAMSAGAQRRLAEAQDAFERALAHGSGYDEEAHREFARAMLAHVRGDREVSAALCRTRITGGAREGLEEFHWLLGACTTGEERRRSLDAALALRPRHPVALFQRGTDRGMAGDLAGARADLEAALRIRPRFFAARHNLGMVGMEEGAVRVALGDFEEALCLRPDSETALNNRGRARYSLGDRDGALKDFEAAMAQFPDLAWAWINRGHVRFTEGDAAGALADFEEAVRRDPSNAVGWGNRAVARLRVRDLPGALADADEAVRRAPTIALSLAGRGAILLEMGRYPEAEADLRGVLAAHPGHAEAWANLGVVLEKRGDPAGALAAADRALALAPDRTDAVATRGLALLALGRGAEARHVLEEALRRVPADDPARGDLEEALRRIR
ncbi:MAG: protein kinase [Planctomycetes bacterium]|nr:protein kinase [Planctomycetota bacterium]